MMRRNVPASPDGSDFANREASDAAAHGSDLPLDEQDRISSALSEALQALSKRLDSIPREGSASAETQARRTRRAAAPPPAARGEPQREGPDGPARARRGRGLPADLEPLSAKLRDELVISLRSEIGALASRLEAARTEQDGWTPTVIALREDIERLSATVSGLATRGEVATLDHLIRGLGHHLERSEAGSDLSVVAGPLEQLQAKVRHLSDEVAANVYGRIASDLHSLAHKVDLVAASGIPRPVIEALGQQIADLQRALSELADPQAIERLVDDVARLSIQVGELHSRMIEPQQFAALKEAMEELRASLETTKRQDREEVPQQLEHLNRRLDVLMDRPADLDHMAGHVARIEQQLDTLMQRVPTGTDTLMSEVERLSDRLDRMSAANAALAIEPLFERLDRLDEILRDADRGDLRPIEQLLQALDAKLDRASASTGQVETLERAVIELAVRLDRHAEAQPSWDEIHQVIGDLVKQVQSLRENTAAVAERAARAAVKDVQASHRSAAGAEPEAEALRRGFADLKALHTAADRKTQQTLQAVHNALETLVMRSAAPRPDAPGARPQPRSEPGAPTASPPLSPAVRLEAAVRKLHAAAMAQASELPSALTPARPASDDDLFDEVLLEPGTPRPPTTAHPESEVQSGHVRANFIAAARRAAQAAVSETHAAGSEDAVSESSAERASMKASRLERLRRALAWQRRPLLLGLAVVVLVVGSLQLAVGLGPRPAERAEHARPVPDISAPLSGEAPEGAAVAPQPAEPRPHPQAPPELRSESGHGLFALPFVPIAALLHSSGGPTAAPSWIPNMTAGDLPRSVIPAALRRAALAGDPAAVHEIASRAAEGRGMAQDVKLAAKLFEKGATADWAPAQFRLGQLYEKGLGVARDPGAARTWYQRAAEKGNARAMHSLAVLLAGRQDGRPDYAAAVPWFREAAQLSDSQFNLAVLLANGVGTPQDLPEAYTWFSILAAQGDQDAAKSRQELAPRLSIADREAARTAAQHWRPRPADQTVNESIQPSRSWTDAPARRDPHSPA